MSFREKGLAIANKLRQLPSKFDIRLYDVFVRVTTWTGTGSDVESCVPGQGTSSVVDTPLYLDGYGISLSPHILPKITALSARDIIASGGLYKDGDYKIDFITPEFTVYGSGGVAINLFEPIENTLPTEIVFVITGPEFPDGAVFKKIETYTYRPFRYSFVVRKIGSNA